MPEYCEIQVKGHLDPGWSEWFGGLALTHLEGDGTLLSGPLPDQAALHGLLERIRDLNLVLVSVKCGDSPAPSLKGEEEEDMSSPKTGSGGGAGVIVALVLGVAIVAVVGLGFVVGLIPWPGKSGGVLTEALREPLDGVTTARFDINAGDGNLTIDWLRGGEPLLAGGTLQYAEKQGVPERTLSVFGTEATLTLTGGSGSSWLRLPWAACNGATEWQIQLNPTVSSDIVAHSEGGNISLNLAGMANVTSLSVDTGGGNVDIVLPDTVATMEVIAKTGAGNVTVSIPSGVAARIQATSGLGGVIVDPQFSKVGDDTYQSTNYDSAAAWVDITAGSGAGDVSVTTR